MAENLKNLSWRKHVMEFRIRKDIITDIPFMKRMLYEAAYWNPAVEKPPFEKEFSQPKIAVILKNWGRSGDIVLIAEISGNHPIGAAWFRFYTKEMHSYGFYNERTPEIAVTVQEEYRNKGVGTALLKALIAEARWQNIKNLSLSVETGNYAVHMYEKIGFRNIVGQEEKSWTIVLELC